MLVIFSGGSGVGKNTVISELLKFEGFELLPTYTTRLKRETESNGNPYFFITNAEFEKKIEENEFYEYETVHGCYYGTSKKLLTEKQKTNNILLKDIDVLGTHNLVNRIGADIKLVTIFLKVDSKEVLVERLKQRKEKDIEKRLSRYDMEQSHQHEYNYIITNNDLETTKRLVFDIINFEKESEYLYATRNVKEINESLVYEYANRLKQGEILSPIKIAVKEGKIYIIEGHQRYLASIMTGVKIAQEIVFNATFDEVEQYSWLETIQFYKNKE